MVRNWKETVKIEKQHGHWIKTFKGGSYHWLTLKMYSFYRKRKTKYEPCQSEKYDGTKHCILPYHPYSLIIWQSTRYFIANFLKAKQFINCKEIKADIEYFFATKPEDIHAHVIINWLRICDYIINNERKFYTDYIDTRESFVSFRSSNATGISFRSNNIRKGVNFKAFSNETNTNEILINGYLVKWNFRNMRTQHLQESWAYVRGYMIVIY